MSRCWRRGRSCLKSALGQYEALRGAVAETTKDSAQTSTDVDACLAGGRLTGQRATDAGRRVGVGGREALLATLEPVELEVILEVERELCERLEGGDEVEVEPVDRYVAAAGAEERRRRVVAYDDRLLRLDVTQPKVQRLVAVTTSQTRSRSRRRSSWLVNTCR